MSDSVGYLVGMKVQIMKYGGRDEQGHGSLAVRLSSILDGVHLVLVPGVAVGQAVVWWQITGNVLLDGETVTVRSGNGESTALVRKET